MMRPWRGLSAALLCFLNSPHVASIELDTSDPASIKAAAKSIAADMMSYYQGDLSGHEPGLLPNSGQPGGYFWWIGGGMFGTLVEYWYYTGDDTYNNDTITAIVYQGQPSETGNFAPVEQNFDLGNDDQSFWALAAMAATEYNFPNPPKGQPQYLQMVENVFDQQNARWDPENCNGGLRWQINQYNAGYDYKNSISNGCFFNLAARLGKYTGNQTYLDAASRTWDWSVSSTLVQADNNYIVIDGIVIPKCDSVGHGERWTYNVGVYLYGAAAMWNATGDGKWLDRAQGLLTQAQIFLKDNVLTEVICEPQGTCKVDQSSFKAYLARWAYASALVCPQLAQAVSDLLLPSAAAAAKSCSNPGGNGGVQCGEKWYTGSFDGVTGIGYQMNAMEVIQTLIPKPGPLTIKTGGTSSGDVVVSKGPNTGIINVTTADKAGASILTILLGLVTIGGGVWIVK